MDASQFLSGKLVPIPLTPGAVSAEKEEASASEGRERTVASSGGAGVQATMVEGPLGAVASRRSLEIPPGFRQEQGDHLLPELLDGEEGGLRGGEMANGGHGRERGHDHELPALPDVERTTWPGGPTTGIPSSFGPPEVPQTALVAPLFDVGQLRRLQDLQESAPQLYGKVVEKEVQRPDSLKKEEEELQNRLMEVQQRRREQEEIRMKNEAAREAEKDMLMQLLEENAKLKEMIWEMKRTKPTSEGSVASLKFETPENKVDLDETLAREPEGDRVPEEARVPEGRRMQEEGKAGKAKPTDWTNVDGIWRKNAEKKETSGEDTTMKFMMTMLEGMQRLMLERGENRQGGENEQVKSMVDLPKLVDWTHETGPIDLGDWLTTIAPYMEDLSEGAAAWWSQLTREAQMWYENHMAMSPMERLAHEVVPTEELNQKRWARLERRAAAMMMGAIPAGIREEIVSTRSVSALGIMTRLLTVYQPGGLAEKSLILASLENPKEEATIQGAVQGLRKWIRWRRRAEDVQVSIPDPTVMVRGLTKLTRKVMASNQELAFRVSLARNTLQVDSIPTHQSVGKIANHILAELEQVAHQDRKKETSGSDPAKMKEIRGGETAPENQKGQGKGKGKDRAAKGNEKGGAGAAGIGGDYKCRFYLTDQGCRKGKECAFSHDQTDGRKRCFNCGSVEHYAPECPRKSSPSTSGSPNKPRAAKAVEDIPKEEGSKTPSEQGAAADGDTMQSLLQEANKMLKSLGKEKTPEVTYEDRMKALQQQLDDLKTKAIRALRLTKMTSCGTAGLIDSGATHPMRGYRSDEDLQKYLKVNVTLASGETACLRMTPGGVMVAENLGLNEVEPIVPLGMMIDKLGCTVKWERDDFRIQHPVRGLLKATVVNGCPQVTKKLALQLIQELERSEIDEGDYKMRSLSWEARLQERAWLRTLVQTHPVFRGLPERLLERLVATPSEDLSELPANRRMRKVWKREGCILHLYAGEREGYTFARAMKEVSGTARQVLELDIKRSDKQDLTKTACYGALLRLAMDGQISTLIGGPNCRTRSVLRSYPGGPPLVRSWGEGEFGKAGISMEEQAKVDYDDELMWKMVLLYVVAKESRKALGNREGGRVGFLLEQPATPHYRPEVVSFWGTSQWKAFKQVENMDLVEVKQGDYGGEAVKPTGLGTNLEVEPGRLAGRGEGRGRPVDGSGDSKALARWAPGLMKAVAIAVCRDLKRRMFVRAIKWEEHLRAGHVPFHRDCRVCQESAAKDRPHRRLRHPKAGVLSLDLAGPLRKEKDHTGPKRYILVGAYTWIEEKGKTSSEEPQEVDEQAPVIEEIEEEAVNLQDEEAADERGGEEPGGEGDGEEAKDGAEDREDQPQGDSDFDIEVFRLAVPVQDRSAEKILEAIIYLYLQLRADGYPIQQIHTDRGREFLAKGFTRWCLIRGIYKTTTSGDSPQQNGRVERAVQAVKARIRTLLLQKGWKADMWPLACWHVHAMERLRRLKKDHTVPGFGMKVLVRKRYWKSRELEPTHEVVEYIASLPEAHGHLVRRDDGALMLAAYVLQRTEQPPELEDTWLAVQTLAEDKEDALQIRRRIRGKTSIRTMKVEEEVEYHYQGQAAKEVLEIESLRMLEDEDQVARIVYHHLKLMMKEVKKGNEEDEEVLRTKVVPVAQFLKEADLWTAAIEAEMNQLFQEKGALRRSSMSQLQRMREAGMEVELIPSKLVITMKPGPKRKIRIVACGNYVESKGEELYAAGADASALRLVLKVTAEKEWELLTTDVRVAFLNAPLMTTLKDGTEGNFVFALKPPSLLIRLKFAREDEVWVAERAMYGLRQAPRRWSIHRDEVLRGLRVKGCTLRQVVSEANLWLLEKDDEEYTDRRMKAMILVYVDDLLISGEKIYADLVVEEIRKIWQTSDPERISDGQATKFLGMEIYKQGPFIKASQTSFIKERLAVNLGENWEKLRGAGTPCGREVTEIVEETEITVEMVREAQRVVGELLWLVTRTRMDLMFVTAKLSQWVLKAPREVVRLSKQVWSFLRRTLHQGILFGKERGEGWAGEDQLGLQSYSDASFAPGGQHSVGAVIVMWNGAPMMWRAGKQPFPTLSAAEAELTEATEAMLMGDAFDALVADIFQDYPRSLMVDNQAAINLIAEESGAWRTRHLRVRACHLRWRFSRLDWRVIHCPGAKMAADLGTKPLTAVRIEELKVICGMSTELEEQPVFEEREIVTTGSETLEKALKLLVMASLLQTAMGQGNNGNPPHERREDDTMMWMIIAAYTFVIVVAVNTFQWVFSTWRTVVENVENGEEEDTRITSEQRRRILAAQRMLRDAEARRNQAEDTLFREITQAYHPDYWRRTPSSQRARDSRSRSTQGRSNRSLRSGAEGSRSGRYTPTEEATPRTEERREESRSQSTRNYASGSGEEERERFNVFRQEEDQEPGQTEEGQENQGADQPVEGQGDQEDQEGQEDQEAPGAVQLPEYRGPGRYIEDAVRGLRRRVDPDTGALIEGEEEEEDQGDSLIDEDEMSVRSERGVEVHRHVGVLRPEPGPISGEGRNPAPDLQPDQEPEDEDQEGQQRREEPAQHEGDDQGRHGENVPPDPPGELPANEVWLTPMGTRYHLSRRCPTLANSRTIRKSEWCQYCARRVPALVRPRTYIATLGDVAHVDRNCIMVGLRAPSMYPCCQVCPTPRGI